MALPARAPTRARQQPPPPRRRRAAICRHGTASLAHRAPPGAADSARPHCPPPGTRVTSRRPLPPPCWRSPGDDTGVHRAMDRCPGSCERALADIGPDGRSARPLIKRIALLRGIARGIRTNCAHTPVHGRTLGRHCSLCPRCHPLVFPFLLRVTGRPPSPSMASADKPDEWKEVRSALPASPPACLRAHGAADGRDARWLRSLTPAAASPTTTTAARERRRGTCPQVQRTPARALRAPRQGGTPGGIAGRAFSPGLFVSGAVVAGAVLRKRAGTADAKPAYAARSAAHAHGSLAVPASARLPSRTQAPRQRPRQQRQQRQQHRRRRPPR